MRRGELIGLLSVALAVVGAGLASSGAEASARALDEPASAGKLIFVSTRSGNGDLFAVNVDGTGLVRLTESRSRDEAQDPVWSYTEAYSGKLGHLGFVPMSRLSAAFR